MEENLTTSKKQYFDKLAQDYQAKIIEVIREHHRREFQQEKPVVIKKELLRNFGMSADLARKIMEGTVTESNSMMHCLDIFENVLNLYDPARTASERGTLLKRKNYFFKRYVVGIDLMKPIVQK